MKSRLCMRLVALFVIALPLIIGGCGDFRLRNGGGHFHSPRPDAGAADAGAVSPPPAIPPPPPPTPFSVTITSPAANGTLATDCADVRFSVSPIGDAGDLSSVRFLCSLDGNRAAPCVATGQRYCGLTEGAHRIDVLPDAGDPDTFTFQYDPYATAAFEVDLPPDGSDDTPPVVAITFPASGEAVSGLAVVPRVRVSELTSSMQCRVDSAPWGACGSVAGTGIVQSGDLREGPAFKMSGGPHTFAITVTDQHGNIGSASVDLIVDALAVTIESPPNSSTIAGPCVDLGLSAFMPSWGKELQYQCSFDYAPLQSCSPADFRHCGLTDGDHLLEVDAHVTGSSVGDPASYSRVYSSFVTDAAPVGADTVPPVVVITSPTSGQVFPAAVTVTFYFSELALARCRVDSDAWQDCSAHDGMSLAVPIGQHTLTVEATDDAGNVGTATVQFAVDPSVVLPPAPPPQ